MASLRWLDIIVIVVYMVAMLMVGRSFAKKQTSTEAYFVAGRSIPHWAMGVSIYATLITSITFIAYPGSAYAGNWAELAPGIMVIGVLILVGTVIIPFFRHAIGMSVYEYFEKRFGYGARAYSAFAFAMGHFSKMGFVFYTLALTVSSMTGWNIYAVMLITGAVTIYYTVIGGMEAVIWTDVIQGFIKVFGIVVCLGWLWVNMPGGIGNAFHLAAEHHKFNVGSLGLNFASKTNFWVLVLYGFFFYLQKYAADQTLVQRYLIAKNDRDALKGVALGAVLCVPAWVLFMLIGTLVWAYYNLSHEVLPAFVDKPDKIFPYFLSTKIPAGLAGLFMAALFSAAMSMLSSDLNCLSVVGVEDYYRKARPQSSDRHLLFVGKLIVGICGALAVGVAMIIAWKSERVLSFWFTTSSIVGGGLAGLFLLAFLCPRANKPGAIIGIVACLVFTTLATLSSGQDRVLDLGVFNFPWAGVLIGVVAHVVLLVFGYLGSLLFASEANTNRAMTLWGWLDRRRQEPAAATS
ncbi:MAG TPA: sodium:solute symporter [Lacunisphaera sp.]|nr:sodium:solute symporter [Lacunisphaera sp.]